MAQYHLPAKIRKAANQNIAEKQYWLKTLSGEPVKSTFPPDCSHTGEKHQEQVIFQIAGDIFSALAQRCRGNLHSLHIYMSAAVMALLSRYNVQEDIIIGTPIYRQDNIDLFINKVLPLRGRVAPGMTFKELLIQVKDIITGAVKNQNYPVEMMVEQLNLSSLPEDFPLFDVSVCVDGIHDLNYLENIPQQIIFTFKMQPQSLAVQVHYNADRYSPEMIERMIGHFKQWLSGALSNLDGSISGIEILTETEIKRMVYELNDTRAGYPTEKTLPSIFAEQVEKKPDYAAVFSHGQTRTNTDNHVTYHQLNEQSDYLAGILIEKGVLPDNIVGIMMERSVEMIIGIMGILKAGGAYMPIDPDYPEERINYMLTDSNARILINKSEIRNSKSETNPNKTNSNDQNKNQYFGTASVLNFENLNFDIVSCFDIRASNLIPSTLAYVIYTSGTTGKPKGVLIEHRHVVRLLFNDRFQFNFNDRDVWTLFHSYCFDFSVWEMYGALLYGGKLIIIPFMTARDPQAFLIVLQKEQVTVLNQTPSAFYRLMREEVKEQKRQLCLKYVIFGGEALAPGQLRSWWEKYPDTALINMYGITETTVHVTFKEIGPEEIAANISNIGKPIPTLSCYAVDHGLKLLPTGAPGELCVGGAGVGRGYLNRPELSAEKFVFNPYKPNERLYRSGDRVCLSANGEMEYRGRIDHQVKIRGFRIEPGEIEKELLNHEGIKEAAVIDRLAEDSESNDRYLCAYYAPFPGFVGKLTTETLREFLLIKLPDYMIPAYFMELETIPLTPNGKIDRKALPLPYPISGSGYKAPQGEIAAALADIWQQVLPVEKISADANFFSVGGDSIKAIKLIGAINTSLGAQLKIIDIYSYQTIETMAQYLAEQLKKQANGIGDIYSQEAHQEIEQFRERMMTPGLVLVEFAVEDVYPMSDIEKGMVFHSLKGAEEGVYHDQITVQQAYRDFNPGLFKKAISLLVQKHPILRTAYMMEESAHIIYKYHESLMNVVAYEDISSQSPEEQETTIKNYIIASRRCGFNLAQPPLWRIGIFKGSGEIIIMVWESHHAIIDGWSNASFLTELNNTYLQLVHNPGFTPVPLKSSYRQFIVRQLAEKRDPSVKDYWLEKLTDYKRFKLPGAAGGDYHIYKNFTFEIGRQVREQLEAAAEKYHTGLKHLCFAAFLYMLNMFSYEPDITAGLVTHNRPETEDGEKILGCFLNTLPFRLKIPNGITWSDYIQLVDQEMVRLKRYEKLSLLEIVKIVEEPVETGNPFFDVVFNLVDFFVYGDLAKSGSELTEKDKLGLVSFARTNFLIEVNIVTFRQEFFFTIHFSTGFITGQDAGRLFTYFKQVLAKFTHQPDSITSKSDVLPEEEKKQLLYNLNDTEMIVPMEQTIDRLFLSQVERTPDRIALLGPSIKFQPWNEGRVLSITYAQLNRDSDALAYRLQEKGSCLDTVVAIMVERSVEMIMGTLAILKAGGAYLPIETDYPQERVDYMLKDSKAEILLTDYEKKKMANCQYSIVNCQLSMNEPPFFFHHSNLSYVIYTSGSTGKPKGVMVEHRSAVNILLYRKVTYEINEQVTSLLLFSYSFDGFVTDCFTPLISGARVVLLGREGRKDPNVIKTAIAGNKVTHVFCTPPLFQAVIEALTVNEAFSLQVVTLGGDRLPLSLLAAIKEKNAAVEVVHEYGVTEAAVTSTLYRHQEGDRQIKIGRPVWNTIINILDARGELQPIGIAGEMLIGGVGIARGYLNNPELTANRFNRSYGSYKTYILFYKTGDLARWLPAGPPAGGTSGGVIEFLGRIDYQVKIRGFRIELGEIESRLQKIPGIQQAVVLAKPDQKGNNYLCAYIVNDRNITDDFLKECLARDLPGYMIPGYFLRLDKIPLTPSGKIDTKNLPGMTISTEWDYVAPRNEVEKRLAEVWQDVLGMEQAGIKDNFFLAGGDSIKAMQMVSRLKKYGLAVKINDLFARPTIEKLAPCTYAVTRQISQEVVQGEVPLTPIQHWFFANNFTCHHHFNQAVMLYRADGFDEGMLQKVFTKLVAHHDALRMVYEYRDDQVIQRNRGLEGKLFDLEVFDSIDNQQIQQQATRIQGSMDLVNGPLIKMGLFKTGQGDHLLVAIHHLVVDGVSWRILLEDIHTGYAQAQAGQPIKFPEKTDSFKYWSQELTQYAQALSPIKNSTTIQPMPLLPRDRVIDSDKKKLKYVDAAAFELTQDDTRNLLKNVNRAYNTEINDILLTALGLAVKEWAGIGEILINLEGHGREGIIEGIDISRTVGWFTSQFPVLLDMSSSDDISYAIKNVKETLRRVPHKGIDFGIYRYLTAGEKTGNSLFQLEPEIGFNYLGQFDSPGETPEKAEKLIQISSLGSGQSMSGEFEQLQTLVITGIITAGKLALTFTYNRHEFDKTTIDSLAGCFQKKLLAITGHCLKKQEPELTPADVMNVSHTALSLAEFSGIQEHIAAAVPGKPAIESIYLLSPMQKGILFHWLTRSEYDIYFIQNIFRLEGRLDKSILADSINHLIARYDIFRTIFMHQGLPEPLQVVLNRRSIPVHDNDIAHLPEEEQERVLTGWLRKEKESGFDLSSDVMMRITLFRTGMDRFCLGWGFHHILMDGWCMGIIYNELLGIYAALAAGKAPRLSEVTPYRHYIQWLMKQDKAAGLSYWQNYLAGYENQAGLPRSNADANAYRLAECVFETGPGITSQLSALAGNHAVTLNTVFQTIWGVALQKYNNSNDVVFGVIVSGRPPELPGIEQMVGLFINTIPVRLNAPGEQSFANLVRALQQESTLSKSYEYLPLVEIQSLTSLKSNLINHILVFENYPLHRQVKNAADSQLSGEKNTDTGWRVMDINVFEQTNYDFYITVIPGENITVKLSYNASVYNKSFIDRTAGHIREIMRQVIHNPEIPLKDIIILTAEERENILAELNRTDVPFPTDKTIHELFETQVEKTPDHIAVFGHGHASTTRTNTDNYVGADLCVCPNCITYRQLHEQSDQLAGILIEKGVLPDMIVGIMMERSVEMITGILGILKSGGAYMPIDPDYPEQRINYMLKDSAAKVLITNDEKKKDNCQYSIVNCQLSMSMGEPRAPLHHSAFALPRVLHSNLSYVIYTSGSTGKPKGTLIEHRHVVRLLFNDEFQFNFNNNDVWTLFHSFCFDFSVWEMYGSLLYGGKLVIIPKAAARDPWEFLTILKNQCATVLNQTPASFYNLINEEMQAQERHLHLRYVIFGGEALNPAKLKPWQAIYPGCLLVNMYGITETTVHVTYKQIGAQETALESSNIGRPIPTLCIYLLDRDLNQMPRGAAGELCIGGEGVARGYLNRPELTAEKFIFFPNFLTSSLPKFPLYCSGDMARLLENGDIEYLGRIDQQVKIRGFRIETGEIEIRLLKKPGIRNAAVLPRQDQQGNKYLCAYIVTVTQENTDPVELRAYLAKDLPEYMIPAYFISIDKIPLTANGKIDRQALPLPDAGLAPGKDYIEPRREIEKQLAGIWQDVLGLQQVGIRDNFFALGGDSIKAILVSSRLKKYGWELKINDLFAYPIIEQLAQKVTQVKRQISQGTVQGEIPLTPVQHWFFLSYSTAREHFNQAVMLYREKGIDEEILKQVFTRLTGHHDALRMVYEFKNGLVIQRNRGLDGKLFDLDVMDLKHMAGKELEDEIDRVVRHIQASIDLTQGPLVKLGLFKTGKGDHLLIAVHHLVIDGVSWRILLEDFHTGYKQAESGQSIHLPGKTDSFQYWSQRLAQYTQTPMKSFTGGPGGRFFKKAPLPLLPCDRVIDENHKKLKYVESIAIEFSETDSERLLKKVNRAFNTEINDLLLTALGLAVKEWSGLENVAVSLEGHGREEIIDGIDISRTVGWFTSLFPVILDMKRCDELANAVKNVKETLRRIPAKGMLYGIAKYLAPKNGTYPEGMVPEIMFNYLGQFSNPGETTGKDGGMFEFSPLAAAGSAGPETEQIHKLTINGMMVAGKLSVSFVYNRLEYDEKTIRALADSYQTHLLNLIDFCCGYPQRELTPSDVMDVTDYDISLEEFDGIMKHVETNIAGKTIIEAIYPLNPMQKGMFYHWLTRSEYDMYFIQSIFKIEGSMDKLLLEQSFNKLIERYDIFRTIFIHQGLTEPLQVVLNRRHVPVAYHDLSRMPAAGQEQKIEEWRQSQKEQGFDLNTDVMMRLTLFKIGDRQFQLAWEFHHILMDGWCLAIIYNELIEIYQALISYKIPQLREITPYKNYIQWWTKQDKDAGLAYWENYLAGYETQAGLPRLASIKSSSGHYHLAEHEFEISAQDSAALSALAGRSRVTLNILFQALWGFLLQKYNNTHDVVFGAVVSGRPPEVTGVENMVGLFINTVPVRVENGPGQDFLQLANSLQISSTYGKSFEYVPLADIQAKSNLKGNLIDHIMIFENYPISSQVKDTSTIRAPQLDWQVQELKLHEQTNYDFNIAIIPTKAIVLILSYNAFIYEETFIKRVEGHIKEILRQVLANPTKPLAEISILTTEEKKQLLIDFNRTEVDYPRDKCIHQLFEEQVEKSPDNIALVGPAAVETLRATSLQIQITYRQLNDQSNYLAGLLIEKGVLPDTMVGIMLERSVEMVIGILGILKSGGAYLPIDPGYPQERIDYMLKDSNAKVLITNDEKKKDNCQYSIVNCQLSMSMGEPRAPLHHSAFALPRVLHSNLSYVIYTSGTTGRPKGVLIEHASVVNRLYWVKEQYGLTGKDVILQSAAFVFDVSVCELFRWIPAGARLCLLPPGGQMDPGLIIQTIGRFAVTTADFVPSVINLILEQVEKHQSYFELASLRWMFTGVEIVTSKLVKRFHETLGKYNHTGLINAYGPTESTVDVTHFQCKDGYYDVVPIGKPMANVQVYIVDKWANLQPTGITGELCIAGSGLARGYLNNPELTRKKFDQDLWDVLDDQDKNGALRANFQHSAFSIQHSNLYRTGDLARWLDCGNIEFLGRIDHQVKIRGFRIELGEIENSLLKHDYIKEAVVIDRKNSSENFLCAYIVPLDGHNPGTAELKTYLSASLPDYMIPSFFIFLNSIPLTPNGKVDRKALPHPVVTIDNMYSAPRNGNEIKLTEIWSRILEIKKDAVGIDSDFFQLGGHSLKTIMLTSLIHKEFNIKIPLEELFKTRTVRGQAEYIAQLGAIPQDSFKAIEPVEQKEYYELSSAQKRLYFLQQMKPGSTAYNIFQVVPLGKDIDTARLEDTIKKLVNRHESLRTSFEIVNNEPVQRIHENVEIKVFAELFSKSAPWPPEAYSFNLSQPPLFHTRLIKMPDNHFLWLVEMHHIVSDGLSMGILAEDFSALYNGGELSALKLQYKDFAAWQNCLVADGTIKKQEEYWLNLYGDAQEIPRLQLFTDHERPPVFTFSGAHYSFALDSQDAQKFQALASRSGGTLYMNILAALNTLFYKYTGQTDIIIGSGIAGRSHIDLQKIIGMFVNMLAIRNHPHGEKTYVSFFQEVIANSTAAFANQDVQFEELVNKLDLERDPSRTPLFDISMVVQDTQPIPGNKTMPSTLENLSFQNPTAKFDMTFFISPQTEEINIDIEYYTGIFAETTIQRLAGHFKNIIHAIVTEPTLALKDIEMISAGEKRLILEEFNKTAAEYPNHKTIHGLFEDQAQRTPDHIAIFGHGRASTTRTNTDQKMFITYRELDEITSMLAGYLVAQEGIELEDRVVIYMSQPVLRAVAILGTLKSGAAYVPIAPSLPVERVKYMIKDASAALVLSETKYNDDLNTLLLDCDSLCGQVYLDEGMVTAGSQPINITPINLAYIIYTSGSTGRPKGVQVEHGGVVNMLSYRAKEYAMKPGDAGLQLFSYVFDGFITGFFTPLISGARLVLLADNQLGDAEKICEAIITQRITHFISVPGLYATILPLLDFSKAVSLKVVTLAGERIPAGLLEKPTPFEIVNEYGITECSVLSTLYRHQERNKLISIGHPIANTGVFILDQNLKLLPIGVYGELCISGQGLARGYLNNPELTRKKFDQDLWDVLDDQDKNGALRANFQHSAFSIQHSNLYCTGDLARWLPSGSIEFLGRIDHQVKIRGFRIELGEIQNRLLKHPAVKEAVVINRLENREPYLCAYVVPHGPIDIPGLRAYLAQHLPPYMIPHHFIIMDHIPLTASGKIDRKALPAPKPQNEEPTGYTAPASYIENKLALIWSDLLAIDREQISMDANFFQLGGHSLKATILAAKIHKELNIKIPLAEIFKIPTIRELARHIEGMNKDLYAAVEPAEKREYYPLSSAQKRLYFLQQLDLTSTGYNMPMVLPLDQYITKNKLESTLKQLIARHESLRTSFEKVNEEVVQVIHNAESIEFSLSYFEAEIARSERLIKNFIRPFDLSRAPLIRSALIRFPDGNHAWIVDVHHIISDGTSHTILNEDFAALYSGKELKPLFIQYKEFALWQNQLFANGGIQSQEAYWLELYAGEIPRLNLPTDYRRPNIFTFAGDHCLMQLGKENTGKFKALGNRYGGTLYMNMLAALNTLFYKYTGQTDIIIGSGIAGRRHADIQAVVGMFVNTLAIRNFPTGEKSYDNFLKEVIANSVKIFENQDVQFEELVEKLCPERDPSRNPLFDVSMVVQNFRGLGDNENTEIIPFVGQNIPTLDYKNRTSKFDLTFFIHESADDIHIKIEYYTGIFKEETIIRLISHLENIIKAITVQPSLKLRDIDIMSEDEKCRVLYEFNDTAAGYPKNQTIHGLFEEQVSKIPDCIALVYEDKALSFRELDQKTNQLAHYLHFGRQLRPETLAGILLDRSLEQIIAILAVLKAGGGYLPLDNALPESRIKNMIDDARVSIVLSSRKFIRILNKLQWECKSFNTFLCLDSAAVYLEEETEKSGLMDENLWDYVANSAVDEITGGGWFNSYTGEAFTSLEMDEYGDNISKKLTPLLHEKMKVLEIGCGSGISMFRIAPKTGIYHATDLSRGIIENNRKKVLAEGHTNIFLSHLAAHEIDQLEERKFDLVIINSVIQSFHGFNYLRKVIVKAIDMIGDKGYLFLGDILDLELKQSIIEEMIEFKYHDSRANSKTKTDWSADLFVPRSFFVDLHVDIPAIEKVEFSDKIHTVENELTRFRYDALITVNKHKIGKNPGNAKQKYQDDWQILGKFSTGKISVSIQPSNPAYVIYTSGSTGKPKGVVVEHRNVIRLVKNSNYIRHINFTGKDRFMLTGAFAFDISTFEIWGMLLNGLGICLVDKNVLLDIEKLNAIISKEQISIIHFTPQLLQEIVLHCPGIFEGIRCLLVGGDIVTPSIINRLRNNYKHLDILHMYGPTENTTFSTFFSIDKEYDTNIPIGKPISNSSIYILDSHGGLQPLGIPGELCTGGDGVARGYLNRPELTREKFDQDLWDVFDDQDKNGALRANFQHSAFSIQHSNLYHTGDLAKWLPDGNIEFLGRIDTQVKIRGFRIELGEIETRLINYPGIKEAIVLALEENDKYLCAYLVADDEKEVTQLREVLARELPDYMVPSYFIMLDKIPLTPNGKVDRKALPKPGLKAGESYTAPRDEIEKKLAGIWAGILGRNGDHSSELQTSIGIDDNFFQVGGHSLKATVLATRIKKEWNVSIPLAEIFKNSTIRGQANYVRSILRTGIEPSIPQDEHLVQLKVGSPYSPSPGTGNLFLIHDGTGEVEGYLEFCQNLPECYNCWGLRFERLENLAPRHMTIQELAKQYIAALKKIQPQGPYMVAGWSLGGIIAYEMAVQLEQAGESLSMLTIFDSPPPLENVSIDSDETQPFNLQTECEFIKDYVGKEFLENLKNTTGITIQQFWPLVVDYLQHNHFDVENIKKIILEYGMAALPNYEHLGLEEVIYYLNVGRTLFHARANYSPSGKISAPIHYIEAEKTGQAKKIKKEAWNEFTTSTITYDTVPGDHYSIFRRPQVNELAILFNKRSN